MFVVGQMGKLFPKKETPFHYGRVSFYGYVVISLIDLVRSMVPFEESQFAYCFVWF